MNGKQIIVALTVVVLALKLVQELIATRKAVAEYRAATAASARDRDQEAPALR